MALAIPSPPDSVDDWWVSGYWRVIWLAPAGLAVIHSILLMVWFNHESPVTLLEKGADRKELEAVMGKFYHDGEIQVRIAALKASQGDGAEPSYYETFFDPEIRQAAWVGIGLATFQ